MVSTSTQLSFADNMSRTFLFVIRFSLFHYSFSLPVSNTIGSHSLDIVTIASDVCFVCMVL